MEEDGHDNMNIITLLHAQYIVKRMRNPHYHLFAPRIPGIWYRMRSFVWKISQHGIQRLTLHTVHLMTPVRAPAGLVFFFLPVLSSVEGLNSLSAHLCSWQTLALPLPLRLLPIHFPATGPNIQHLLSHP